MPLTCSSHVNLFHQITINPLMNPGGGDEGGRRKDAALHANPIILLSAPTFWVYYFPSSENNTPKGGFLVKISYLYTTKLLENFNINLKLLSGSSLSQHWIRQISIPVNVSVPTQAALWMGPMVPEPPTPLRKLLFLKILSLQLSYSQMPGIYTMSASLWLE